MRLEFVKVGGYDMYSSKIRYDFEIIYLDKESRLLPVFEKEFRLNCRNQLLI